MMLTRFSASNKLFCWAVSLEVMCSNEYGTVQFYYKSHGLPVMISLTVISRWWWLPGNNDNLPGNNRFLLPCDTVPRRDFSLCAPRSRHPWKTGFINTDYRRKAVLRIRDVYPGSWFISNFPSRIPDPEFGFNDSNRKGGKICCPTFFCRNKYEKINNNLSLNRYRTVQKKNLSQFTKNF